MSVLWFGEAVFADLAGAAVEGLERWGLEWEGAAKDEVVPGAGVLTGTYRRSLHSAGEDYNFGGDNVKPTRDSPDRGGMGTPPTLDGMKVTVVLGSGMNYARDVEDRYRPVAGGYDKIKGRLEGLIGEAAGRRGLR